MGRTGSDEAIRLRVEQWPFVTMPSKLIIDRSLSDAAKMTYAALALWGGMDGKAFPSRGKLADARGVKRSTVYAHLKSLESAGWISRQTQEMPNGAVVSVVTVKRGPDNWTGGSRNIDQGVQESGRGGPEIGTHKDNQKEKKKESYVHPFNLSSLSKEREKELSGFALRLRRVYPHGWGDGGKTHDPGFKKVMAYLDQLDPSEWETLLDCTREYGRKLKGSEDQKFVVAMWRWITDSESWRYMHMAQDEESGEFVPLSAEAAEEARVKAVAEQASSYGIVLDPETHEVIDWGPDGPPDNLE